jgi:hypothetical protein
MPYQDSQQLSISAFERIAASASSNECRLKDNVNVGQVLGELQHEIRFEYSRAMNKLLFDATVCYFAVMSEDHAQRVKKMSDAALRKNFHVDLPAKVTQTQVSR